MPSLTPDLYSLRDFCNARRIMLCFNGPISRSLIEEIGNALRNYLQVEQVQPSAAMDVFAVYIEMSQNIRHYVQRHGYNEVDAVATVVIARDEQGRHVISAGNLIEADDADALQQRIEALAPLDRASLKARYKEQLRAPRDAGAASGAGLGLIDIARRASEPLQSSVVEHAGGRRFITLTAVI